MQKAKDGLARIVDFYPRPPGGGRQLKRATSAEALRISIHALRVEGDAVDHLLAHKVNFDFYPRPPGGGRLSSRIGIKGILKFLSTPSGWRATKSYIKYCYAKLFLSTPSGWRATTFRAAQGHRTPISIHALRVEGDIKTTFKVVLPSAFLSTPSGWRATAVTKSSSRILRFLSTPSGWRATNDVEKALQAGYISIHALRVEGDNSLTTRCISISKFLSTPSGWRATYRQSVDYV